MIFQLVIGPKMSPSAVLPARSAQSKNPVAEPLEPRPPLKTAKTWTHDITMLMATAPFHALGKLAATAR